MNSEVHRLRDGSTVTTRPVGPQDEGALLDFLTDLCFDSRRLRFFTGGADMGIAAHWAADMGADRYGLLACDGRGAVVGHAVYVRVAPARAEVAVEVADRFHGHGLATILVTRLAAVAERCGLTTFTARVLPENRAMLDVFRDGFDAQVTLLGDTDAVEFPTAAWRSARERFAVDTHPPERPDDGDSSIRR
jgi:GNAT superfamily N-acetyltransferase